MNVRFTINSQVIEVDALPMARLLDVLREELRLTGTKEGCGEGECGACTVLVDGVATNSCLVPVVQVQGASVQTIEGLAASGRLSALQDSFLAHGAAQCGICTPGLLMMAAALLAENPHPTPAQAREGLAGNLCRCTGYQKVIDAVVNALPREEAC